LQLYKLQVDALLEDALLVQDVRARAYVLDQERVFEKRVNLELVQLERLEGSTDIANVRTLLERHFVATQSNLALEVLTNWDDYQELFWMVIPRGTGAKLEQAVSAKEG
ncbi:MAG: hypothetical protein HY353_05275, partial [Candidatus Omnitrophica bacterium]|nr:hypothetical protein [Candidatus Omnitrophota bacterium]